MIRTCERQIGARTIRTIERGDGPRSIVFFHGFPDTFETFRPLFERWETPGYRLISVPMPGYAGEVLPEPYRVDSLARDVVQRLDDLGLERPLLVGHDWGAIAGWGIAAHRPERVSGVVAMSAPPLWRYLSNGLGRIEQYWHAEYVFRFQLPIVPELGLLSGSEVPRLWKRWSATEPPSEHVAEVTRRLSRVATSALAYYRGLRELAWRSELRRWIAVPPRTDVLAIHGDADACIATELWRDVAAWTEASTQVRRLEGVGHFPQWEATDSTIELISKFASSRYDA